MGTEYLMDSNAIIDFLGDRLTEGGKAFMNEVVNQIPKVSVISKIEVLGFNAPPKDSLLLEAFFQDAQIYPLDSTVVDITIQLRKILKIKMPDAIIAATALAHQLTIVTRNTSDFDKIPGVVVIDPHSIGA
ncbi:MAG: type II toxin-antitoxin system VapC family toxin [Chitinophagales bacterium]|nr:type II toxin-antitoxin system VapC family toxin [Chitinophagales bacterium]